MYKRIISFVIPVLVVFSGIYIYGISDERPWSEWKVWWDNLHNKNIEICSRMKDPEQIKQRIKDTEAWVKQEKTMHYEGDWLRKSKYKIMVYTKEINYLKGKLNNNKGGEKKTKETESRDKPPDKKLKTSKTKKGGFDNEYSSKITNKEPVEKKSDYYGIKKRIDKDSSGSARNKAEEERIKRGDASYLLPDASEKHEKKLHEWKTKIEIVKNIKNGKALKKEEASSSYLQDITETLKGMGHFAAAITGDLGRLTDLSKLYYDKFTKKKTVEDQQTQKEKSIFTAVSEMYDLTLGKISNSVSSRIGGTMISTIMNTAGGYFSEDVKGIAADKVFGKDKALVVSAKESAKNLGVSDEAELMRTFSTNVDEAGWKKTSGGFLGAVFSLPFKLAFTAVQKGLDLIANKRRKTEAEKMERVYRVIKSEIERYVDVKKTAGGGKANLNYIMRRLEKQKGRSAAWHDLQNDLIDTYPPRNMKGGGNLADYIPEVMKVMRLKYPKKFSYSYKDARDQKTGVILTEAEVKNRQAKRYNEIVKEEQARKNGAKKIREKK